jgi:hypothetical protein
MNATALRLSALLLPALLLPALTSLPGCDPTRSSDDDDSATGDDDDSTPLAECPGDEDGQEEDDDWTVSTTAAPGTPWDGVACPSDPDVYRMEVPNCRVWEMTIDGAESSDLTVTLLNDDGTPMSSVPTTMESGGLGYQVSGTTWTEPNDDDDVPPPARVRFVEVLADSALSGGLAYGIDVESIATYNCDE